MKLKIITTVSDLENPGLHKLEASLRSNSLDYKIIHSSDVNWGWGGWDTVMWWLGTKEAEGYTHFIYTDGFDTLALTGQEEIEKALETLLRPNPDAFIYSVEKHWFPCEDGWEKEIAEFNNKLRLPDEYRWRYVNGGQWAGSVEAIKKWYINAPKTRNNQAWGNAYFAKQPSNDLILDFKCLLFQTLSHSGANHGSPDEFTVENKRLTNNLTGTKPCFVHNNGIKNPHEQKFMYDIIL